MIELPEEEYFESYPYLKKMAKTTIFESQKMVEAMKNSEKVGVGKES